MHKSILHKPLVHGFTLIELIIVMTIIGLLAVASGAAYIGTLRTSRDGRRKVDLENIRAALEMYHSDNSTYPDTSTQTLRSILDPPSGKKYISMPVDPKTKADYPYEAIGCEDIGGVTVCNDYSLGAVLEDTTQLASSGCPSGCATPCTFCVSAYGPLPTVTPTLVIGPDPGGGGEPPPDDK